jgi:hypothetical protein
MEVIQRVNPAKSIALELLGGALGILRLIKITPPKPLTDHWRFGSATLNEQERRCQFSGAGFAESYPRFLRSFGEPADAAKYSSLPNR